MTEASERQAMQILRSLLSPSSSGSALASLTPQAAKELERLIRSYPYLLTQARASRKQLAFQRAFFDRRDAAGAKRDIIVAMGGNRSGKSIVCGHLCFGKYVQERAVDGDTFWCISQNLERSVSGQQRELWAALPRWMFGAQVYDPKLGFGQHRKIILELPEGRGRAVVEFRSADQDPSTFEQAKLRGVWMDERIPELIYDRILPRIVDLDGWVLYSDIPEQWWHISRLKEAAPEAGVHYVQFRMQDNASNLPPGAVEKFRGRISSDEAKMRIDGEHVIADGLVYKEFAQRHVITPFAIPAHWPRWRAIDYGSSAPTACVWFAIAPNECVYVYREHYDAGHSVPYNAERIIAASEAERYRVTLMDPHAVDKPPAVYGTAPSVAEQYAAAGIQATGWPFVNIMGEHAMVQRVKFRLENDTLKVFETCPNVIREFRSWMYKRDKAGKALASDGFEAGNEHSLDCIKGFLGTNPCYSHGGLIEAYSAGQGAAEDE